MVLVAHGVEAIKGYSRSVLSLELGGWTTWLAPGGFWVGGFFVLSGFCIALSLRRTVESGKYSKKTFVLQRITRIYPLYLVGLIASIGVFSLLGEGGFPWESLAANIFSLQGFVAEPFPFYEPSWSIAYEMVYYLLVPIFLSSAKPDLKRYFWVVSIVMVCASFLFGLTWKILLDEANWMIPLWTVPWSGLMWMIGFGGVVYNDSSLPRKLGFLFRPNFILAIAILSLCYLYRTFGLMSGWPSVVRFLAGPLVGYGFLLLVLSLPKWPKIGSSRLKIFSQWAGLLSYPLYLLHMPLQTVVMEVCRSYQLNNLVDVLVLMILIPLTVCGTLGVALERAILEWRKKVLKKQSLK